MGTMFSKPLSEQKLEKIIAVIKERGFPVFDMDMGRDEVAAHETFFLYNEKGRLQATEKRNQYKREFVLMFVTRAKAGIEEMELIEDLRLCGLIFDDMEQDEGRLLDTDDKAEVLTFTFHYPVLYMR